MQANAKQLDWEKQFDAQLNGKEQDTWMQFLSSHPHHVGSPQDKANADYIVNFFVAGAIKQRSLPTRRCFRRQKQECWNCWAVNHTKQNWRSRHWKQIKHSGQKSEQLPTYNAY